MSKPSILVSHPWIENGGSEATAMWALGALQDDFDLTLVTAVEVDFEKLNQIFGTTVDPDKVTVLSAPRIPFIKRGDQLVALQHALFQRHCRRLANRFDLCISAYNFVDFGKPGIQLIGDLSFNEHLRKSYYVHGQEKFHHRPNLLRKAYIGAKEWINPENTPYNQRGDLVLANSKWTADQLEEHCDLEKLEVLYPPVTGSELPIKEERIRKQFGFFYIGRIAPEKEIEEIIVILDRVRAMGYPVDLDLAGNSYQSPYEKKIAAIATDRPWINDLGYLSGEKKEAAFLKNSFGIQACRCEAFGIAAAELAARGCLPLVPENCGPSEVVPVPELQFQSTDDAVDKIVHLFESPDQNEELRNQMVNEMSRFAASKFVSKFRKHVENTFQKSKNGYRSSHVIPQEDLSSLH